MKQEHQHHQEPSSAAPKAVEVNSILDFRFWIWDCPLPNHATSEKFPDSSFFVKIQNNFPCLKPISLTLFSLNGL